MTHQSAESPSPSRELTEFTPVPRATNRSDGWKPEIQRAFIAALADTGSVADACRMVRRSTGSAYALRRHPDGAGFAAAWLAAQSHGILRLQDAVIDRALNGVDVPVVAYDKVIATRKHFDNRLAAFILRNHMPEQYGEGRRPHAIDARKLERQKREWRAEWEAEREAQSPSPADIRASIERRMQALRRRVAARTSPRAYEQQMIAHAQRHADEAAGWRAGEPYEPYEARAAELLPQCLEQVRRDWPEYEPPEWTEADEDDAWDEPDPEPTPEPPALPGPRVRTLKDESWRD